MKFNVNQQDLQKSLNYCQGVIEKRSTLPILSNILLETDKSRLTITATDLDLIFIHQINNVEVLEEGKTTTMASTMYDIVRKFSSGKKINLSLSDENRLHLESEKSVFNLNCLSPSEFPVTEENFNQNEFSIKSKQLLKLLNKCKFSVSNDETRHYLSGIFLHQTQLEEKTFSATLIVIGCRYQNLDFLKKLILIQSFAKKAIFNYALCLKNMMRTLRFPMLNLKLNLN